MYNDFYHVIKVSLKEFLKDHVKPKIRSKIIGRVNWCVTLVVLVYYVNDLLTSLLPQA